MRLPNLTVLMILPLLKVVSVGSICPNPKQCDQMARLFVQYLPIDSDENLPNSIKIGLVLATLTPYNPKLVIKILYVNNRLIHVLNLHRYLGT